MTSQPTISSLLQSSTQQPWRRRKRQQIFAIICDQSTNHITMLDFIFSPTQNVDIMDAINYVMLNNFSNWSILYPLWLSLQAKTWTCLLSVMVPCVNWDGYPGQPGLASTTKVDPSRFQRSKRRQSGRGKSLSKQTTTASSLITHFYRPDALFDGPPTMSKHWRQ